MKPGEVFTAERIIEKALRADIGPDPTLAMNRQNYKYNHPEESLFPTHEYKKKYKDNDPVMFAESNFYDYNLIERRNKQFGFDCKFNTQLIANDIIYAYYYYRGKARDIY